MHVAIVAMHRCAPLLLALFLASCTTNAIRIERLADSLGMSRSVVEAGSFRSLVFMRGVPAPQEVPLAIFIEEWLPRIPEFRVKPGTVPKQSSGMVNNFSELWLSWDVPTAA